MQVKIFENEDNKGLQDDVNSWLETEGIEVIDMSYSCSGTMAKKFYITFLYVMHDPVVMTPKRKCKR